MKIIELEALRGFAAFYIFFHHTFVKYTHCNVYIAKFFIFGQEAVILFFLLSGYVIVMSQTKHNYNFKTYFIHRFARIYSIFLPTLIVAYFIYGIVYTIWSIDLYQLLLNILMFQDKPELKPGVWVSPIFHDEPLWSLSYEWWFYIIFFIHFSCINMKKNGLFIFMTSSMLISFIGILTYKLYFNQISLFLMYYFIWASGGFLYLIYHDKYVQKTKYTIFLVILYIFLISLYYSIFIYNEKIFHYVNHPILEIRHYLDGFIFIGFFIFIARKPFYYKNLLIVKVFTKVFTKFAPISFAFYIIHYPIMLLFNNLNINGYLKITIMFTVTVVISYIMEILFYKKMILPRVKKV